MFPQIPGHIQQELEVINQNVKPLIKKSSLYSFISFPMMLFSFLNLFFLIMNNGLNRENLYYIILLALFAAVGMALLKESKTLRKEIQRISNKYIVDRIKKSDILSDAKKKEFIELIKQQPILGFNTFIKFLEEEKRFK